VGARSITALRGWAYVCALVALFATGRVDAQPQTPNAPNPHDEETEAEVFARVFKKSAAPAHIPAALSIDGKARGSIILRKSAGALVVGVNEILIAVGPSLRVEARKHLVTVARERSTCAGREAFDRRRAEREVARVRNVLGEALGNDVRFLSRCDASISIDALRRGGLDVTYDPGAIELRIAIPPEAQEATTHDLNGAPASAVDARRPSAFSGYLNVRATGSHVASADAAATAREPVRLDLDAVVNARGWVLEGDFDLGEPPADTARGFGFDAGSVSVAMHRGDVRVVRDDPSRALRYLAGDYAVPTGGLQPSYQIVGVGVSRNYALQPYRNLQPVGKFDFVLARNAMVTVLVNNAPVQTIYLPAGRHDIRNLKLDGGINDIELVVRDDAGVERRLLFSTASSEELLAAGVAQFSLDVGFPLINDAGLRSYDLSRPILAARRRWGATSDMTAGASFNGSLDHQVAGAALAIATTRGNLSFEVAASNVSDARFGPGSIGHAERLRYHYQRAVQGASPTSFTAVLNHYSTNFRPLDTMPALGADPAGRYSDDVAVAINRGLSRSVTGSLNLRYQLGRNGPDAQDATITAMRAFGQFNVSASMSLRAVDAGPLETRCFISSHWVLPKGRGSLRSATVRSTSAGLTNEVVYTRRSTKPAGGLGGSVALRQGTDAYAVAASGDYTGYRFTSAVSTTSSVSHAGGGQVSQTTSGEFATALVFAGGRMTWSRPVAGSFAIVAANHTIDGYKIGVNPALGGYSTVDDTLGLAVVPNLENYRVNNLRVEAPTLPLGYSLGPASYSLLPTYKSGTLIIVGDRGTVFVRGILHRADGTPIALATGEVQSLDVPTQLPSTLMTNRAGRLSAEGLSPGRYTIRIVGERIGTEIVIPSTARGVFDLGTVKLGGR
jgi:outer membrane usher protein